MQHGQQQAMDGHLGKRRGDKNPFYAVGIKQGVTDTYGAGSAVNMHDRYPGSGHKVEGYQPSPSVQGYYRQIAYSLPEGGCQVSM
jgi:hypothetical protein